MFVSHWMFAFIWLVFTLFILAVVAGVVVLLVRAAFPIRPPLPATGVPGRESPQDILARRFASGEISAEEYQKARDLLQGGPQQPPS